MGVPDRGRVGVLMPKRCGHLEQGPAAIDKQHGMLMAQVMDSEVRHSRYRPDSLPAFCDRRERLASLLVDEQVLESPLCLQLIENVQGRAI